MGPHPPWTRPHKCAQPHPGRGTRELATRLHTTGTGLCPQPSLKFSPSCNMRSQAQRRSPKSGSPGLEPGLPHLPVTFGDSRHSLGPGSGPSQPHRAEGQSNTVFRALTSLFLEAPLAPGPPAAPMASLRGCGCPPGPAYGSPARRGSARRERAAALHTPGRAGAPARRSTRGQPSPAAAWPRGPARASPPWETFSSSLMAGGRFRAEPPRAAAPGGQAASSQSKKASAWTVALLCRGHTTPACRPQGPHMPLREVPCPRRGAPQ